MHKIRFLTLNFNLIKILSINIVLTLIVKKYIINFIDISLFDDLPDIRRKVLDSVSADLTNADYIRLTDELIRFSLLSTQSVSDLELRTMLEEYHRVYSTREYLSRIRGFFAAVLSNQQNTVGLRYRFGLIMGRYNARDITDIRHVEKIRNYLATVVKQSSNAIYIHDNEGNIISWNVGAEQMYGYSEEEALKMKIWNIVPDYLKPVADDTIQQILNGKKIQNLETIRITKHGNMIDVLFSASPLKDPDTGNMTIAITEKDITREKLAEARIKKLNVDLRRNLSQLEITNKELESFSYSVSHDLRAPLRAINGYARILAEELGDDASDELKRLTGVIQSNAIKMGVLIDDLLSFSRMGRKEVQRSHCNMNELVSIILNELSEQIKPNYSITVENIPNCLADPALIRQVWTNLISNAVKYSSKKDSPVILIGAQAQDEEFIYFVKDNGAGFDMKYADKIFGVFQRLHTSEEFEGTGVGLAIVQRVISKHGGRVWVEAEPEKGATFYYSLPNDVAVALAEDQNG